MIALQIKNCDIVFSASEVKKDANLVALAILGYDLKKPISFDRINAPDDFKEKLEYYLPIWKECKEFIEQGVPLWQVADAVKSDNILSALVDTYRVPIEGTKEQIENKAMLCLTKQTAYRKLRKAVAKEEHFLQDLAKAIKVGEIPSNAVPGFTELYREAYSRICMIRAFKRKEFNGKVVGSEKNMWVGMNLDRLVTYLAETNQQSPTDDLLDDIKQMKKNCQTKIDTDFCDGYFKFMEYVRSGEKFVLRDLQTYNVVHLCKKLAEALPHKYYKQFYSTIIGDPWFRCSRNTSRFLFAMCISEIKKQFEEQMGITIKKLHFGVKEKTQYYRFKLIDEDRWHTAETEAEAKIVAKALQKEIEEIQLVDPRKFKAIEILDSNGSPIEHSVDEDGDWAKAEPVSNYFNEL